MPWECTDSALDTSMCRSTEYPSAEIHIILNIWIHLMFWSCILYYYYIHFIQQHHNTKNKAHSPRKLSHLDAITETLPFHSRMTELTTKTSEDKTAMIARLDLNQHAYKINRLGCPHPPKSPVLAVRQIVQNTTREHQLQGSINQQSTGESHATKCYSAIHINTDV